MIALAAVDALLPVCCATPTSTLIVLTVARPRHQATAGVRRQPLYPSLHPLRVYTLSRTLVKHDLQAPDQPPYRRPGHGILSSIHDKYDKHSRTPATPPSSAFLHRLPRGTLHPLSSSPSSLLDPPVLTVDYIPDQHFQSRRYFFICAGELRFFVFVFGFVFFFFAIAFLV